MPCRYTKKLRNRSRLYAWWYPTSIHINPNTYYIITKKCVVVYVFMHLSIRVHAHEFNGVNNNLINLLKAMQLQFYHRHTTENKVL